MFPAPGLMFGGTEGVGSRFQVLRAWTRFRRYRGRRVPFSGFELPESFLVVLRASGPVYIFFAPVLVFGSTDGVGSRFHVLRAPDSFSAVQRDSRHVLMFCALGLIFGGTEGVRFLFNVLCAWTRFWRY
jgi:hypothetical protein